MDCCAPPQEPIDIHPKVATGCLLFSFDVEYLRWYLTKEKNPPLLTIGNPNDFQFGVPGTNPGALGLPGTRILLQNFDSDYGHNGLRLNSSIWFDPEQVLGLQCSYFWLDKQTPSVSAGSDGSLNTFLVARPFFNVATGVEDADPVAVPGQMAGHITISSPSYMMGGEANLCYNYLTSSITGARFGLLAGARFLSFDEKILVNQTTTQLPDAFGTPGPTDVINENFTCYNRFYGGQAGAQMEYQLGPVYLEFVGKVAFGETNQAVNITGSTVQTNPPDPFLNLPGVVASNNALLVQPGNSGHFTRNQFSVIPEGQFNIGWAFNDNVMLRAGYNVIVWDHVVRPGDQINRNINIQPLGFPGLILPNAPTFSFQTSNLWVQGFQVGVEINF